MGPRARLLLLLLALASCGRPASVLHIAIVVDGETLVGATRGPTVRDALLDLDVMLGEEDRVEPPEVSLVQDGMTIRVVRVETETEVTRRVIPFDRRTVLDATLPEGETRLLQPGRNGLEEVTYRATLEDGERVERAFVQRVLLQEARTEIVLVGGRVDSAPIAFRGTIAYAAGGNIWLMRGTTTNRWRQTHSGDLDGRVFRLSPDGAYVLYTRAALNDAGADSEEPADAPFNTLWLMETEPGANSPTRLAPDNVLWADWAPGCRAHTVGSECTIAYSTGVPVTGDPGWRAENDLIIGRPDLNDGRVDDEVRVIEPNSGGIYGWWGTAYAWAPDGRRMAYARADEIGAVTVPTGTVTTLAAFPPFRTYASWVWMPTVSWSVDSKFVVAALHTPSESDPAPEDSPIFDIWAISADGRLQVPLVEESGMWAAPRYAPRAERVAYGQARAPTASGTSGYDLWIMDRDGSDAQRLFPPAKELGLDYPEFAWAPSGGRLMVIYRGNLYLLFPTNDTSARVTFDGDATLVDWR